MTLRLSGLSSGLDTESLIKSIMELQRKPIYQLQDNNKILQAKKNDLSSLKTALFTLSNTLADLTRSSAFSQRTTTTTDEKIVTATAQNNSSNASYIVDVTSMATVTRNTGSALAFTSGTYATKVSTEELLLAGDADANAAFNTSPLESEVTAGYFYINEKRIDVLATDTINTVLNKITASSAGVTATLSGDKITLTQKTVGDTQPITFGTDTSGFLTAAKLDTAVISPGTKADEDRLLKDTALNGTLTDGYFSINGTFFSVNKDTDTLSSIINKINQSTTAGVTAFYDPTSKKISLTSRTTGAKDITLGTNPGTDTSNFLDQVGLVQANQVLGADAAVKVNGVDVTAVNNKVTMNGITFDIKSAGTATVTVKNDVDAAVEKVKSFVTQYNAVIDLINGELSEEKVKDASTDADLVKGNLRADSILTGLRSSLRSYFYATVKSQPADMQQFSQIGISTGAVGSSADTTKDGKMVLDETKLRKALEADADSVASLFGKSSASVTGEELTDDGDGDDKTYTLANTSILTVPAPTIKVGSTVYTLVAASDLDPDEKQFAINYATGQITFSATPVAGTITANYDYRVTDGADAGLAMRMKTMVGELIRAGGTFDTRIGSNGSITKQINYQTKRIDDLERRLQMREEALYRQYTNLETLMSKMNSQSSWLTAQLASLTNTSTSNSNSNN